MSRSKANDLLVKAAFAKTVRGGFPPASDHLPVIGVFEIHKPAEI